MPATVASGPGLLYADLCEVLNRGTEGDVIVLAYHGVPDVEHHWVHTSEEDFSRQMELLRDTGCRVNALKDLKNHISNVIPPGKARVVAESARLLPQPVNLLCEYLENPLGIDLPRPRFS